MCLLKLKHLTKYLYICFTSYATSIVEAAAPAKRKVLLMVRLVEVHQESTFHDDVGLGEDLNYDGLNSLPMAAVSRRSVLAKAALRS